MVIDCVLAQADLRLQVLTYSTDRSVQFGHYSNTVHTIDGSRIVLFILIFRMTMAYILTLISELVEVTLAIAHQ